MMETTGFRKIENRSKTKQERIVHSSLLGRNLFRKISSLNLLTDLADSQLAVQSSSFAIFTVRSS